MSGKITYRHGRHESRSAYYADQITIDESGFAALEIAFGRPLEKHERDRIISGLETVSGHRPRWKISRQDIIKSLTAISKLPAIDALAAMRFMDSSSRALLKDAIRYDCGFREQEVPPPAELVPKAAALAAAEYDAMPALGGRPVNGYQRAIARFAVDTWRAFGQVDVRFWCSTDNRDHRSDRHKVTNYRPPLVVWTSVFLVASREKDGISQVEKLVSEALSDGKVNNVYSGNS